MTKFDPREDNITKYQVFKLQVDLTEQSVLVYNRRRTLNIEFYGPDAKEIIKRLHLKSLQKIFVNGRYNKFGVFEFGDVLPENEFKDW